MKPTLFILSLFLLLPFLSFSQNFYSFRGRVKIPSYTAATPPAKKLTTKKQGKIDAKKKHNSQQITRVDKTTKTESLSAGQVVTREVKFTENGKDYVTKIETTEPANRTITLDDVKKIDMVAPGGWANIYSDKDDPSIIHINYWLISKAHLQAGTQVNDMKNTWANAAAVNMTSTPAVGSAPTSLTDKTWYNLKIVKLPKTRKNGSATHDYTKDDWFKYSPRTVEVGDGKGGTAFYLADKYCAECDYQIKLKNRDYISFKSYSFDLGAVTIPFKVRPGFKKGTNEAKTDIGADFNVGIFGGVSVGKARYRFEKDGLKTLPDVKATFGLFFSIGKQDLDTLSSNTTGKPFVKDEKQSILFASYGVGVMLSVANVKFGAFAGLDSGVGSEAKRWNFNNKPWVGLGLGYNIAGLWSNK